MTPSFDLQRFVDAQDDVYRQVCAELSAGEKTSHWMWFVFPQHRSLGHSANAQYYGIGSKTEATAYLRHPVLGPRLLECTALVLKIEGRTAYQIFHSPDDVKLRSCMTLFAAIAPEEARFRRVLEEYFEGQGDSRTAQLLLAPDWKGAGPPD